MADTRQRASKRPQRQLRSSANGLFRGGMSLPSIQLKGPIEEEVPGESVSSGLWQEKQHPREAWQPEQPKQSSPKPAVQRKLMSVDDFKGISDSAFSGKRNRILKVDEALNKCASASSKSVALTLLISACNDYLDIAEKKDKTRIKGVKALKKNATEELAAWRLRERLPLPASVYRMDERAPAAISKVGFQPWAGGGNVSVIEHVTQVLRTAKPDAPTGESGEVGKGAKKHSQLVSTAANLNFAKDPTLLQGLMSKYFYKIDTTVDPHTFTDVNKHFDEQGEPNPYEPQFEFCKSGGIPGNQVTQYVNGKELADFVIAGTDASTWNITWVDMPVNDVAI